MTDRYAGRYSGKWSRTVRGAVEKTRRAREAAAARRAATGAPGADPDVVEQVYAELEQRDQEQRDRAAGERP